MDKPLSPNGLPGSTMKVHLPNGAFNVIRYGDAADIKVSFIGIRLWNEIPAKSSLIIKGIIQLLTTRLGAGERCYKNLFSIRIFNPSSGEMHWMHQDTTMYQVQEKIQKLNGSGEEGWIFELRVRYLPNDLSDLYEKDKITFSYYYDQVIFLIVRLFIIFL